MSSYSRRNFLALATGNLMSAGISKHGLNTQSHKSPDDGQRLKLSRWRNYKLVARGKGGSPGLTKGRVQRVTIHDDTPGYPSREAILGLTKIQPNDIVLMPDLYPCMLDAVKRAAGLVIYDEHRMTGRGSVVAREFNVPAVINCEPVTSVTTGDSIILDGDNGAIWQLSTQIVNHI